MSTVCFSDAYPSEQSSVRQHYEFHELSKNITEGIYTFLKDI